MKKMLMAFAIAAIVFFGCSSPTSTDDEGTFFPSSSSAVVSSSSAIPIQPSSSSAVVSEQYYDVLIGNNLNSTGCDLNGFDYIGVVIPLTQELANVINKCIINSQIYEHQTASSVSQYLTDNNLNQYANDFDIKMAQSNLGAAVLFYINTNNYYRILVIGYSS